MTTLTVTVPSAPAGRPLFSDIKAAFPGLAGLFNQMSDYHGRHPSLPVAPNLLTFGHFVGLNALTPSFQALANVAVAPGNVAFPDPLSGTNAVFLAGGLLTGIVGGNAAYAASLTVDLLGYLDNYGFHLGTGTCAFSVYSGSLPTGVSLTSASNGTLVVSATAATASPVTVVIKCVNFYGNWNTTTLKINLNPAPYVAGPLAVYTGESFCPTTNRWADVTGGGRTAVASGVVSSATIGGQARACLTGGTAAAITFPSGVLPANYTLVHIAKYNGAGKQRIVTSSDGTDWLSGHQTGFTGVAFHGGYLTANSDFGGGAGWILSTDQNSLYRCNGMALGSGGGGTTCRLGINTYAGKASDWAVAMIAVYSSALTAAQLYNVEQALASQYVIAWKAAAVSNTTIGNNSYTAALATVFQNCTSYAVPSNPYSATAVSGSTMTTTGSYRNTTYNVQVSGTADNGSVALATFNVVENQQPPYLSAGIGTQVLNSGGSLACSSYFGGPGLWYGCSGGYAAVSGSTLNLNTSYRNTAYTVYLTAYNQRYDGGNGQSAQTSFAVYENQSSPYVSQGVGTQTLSAGGQLYAPNYFGNASSYGCSGGYAGMSGNYVNLNANYRNTSYTVTLYAYNTRFDGGNGLSASTSFTVTEYTPAPTANGSPITTISLSGTAQGSVYLPSYFDGHGVGVWFGLGNAAYNTNCSVSGNDAHVNALNRSLNYAVYINCYSAGGSVQAYFNVQETPVNVCGDITATYTNCYFDADGIDVGNGYIYMNPVTGSGTITNEQGTFAINHTGYWSWSIPDWGLTATYNGSMHFSNGSTWAY
jgi:hypothetical protein